MQHSKVVQTVTELVKVSYRDSWTQERGVTEPMSRAEAETFIAEHQEFDAGFYHRITRL